MINKFKILPVRKIKKIGKDKNVIKYVGGLKGELNGTTCDSEKI